MISNYYADGAARLKAKKHTVVHGIFFFYAKVLLDLLRAEIHLNKISQYVFLCICAQFKISVETQEIQLFLEVKKTFLFSHIATI